MAFAQRSTRLVGRGPALRALTEFAASAPDFAWWQIAGEAGQGKSRLALEFVASLAAEWNAGFVDADEVARFDWLTETFAEPTLCVMDAQSAPQRAAAVVRAICALAKRSEPGTMLPIGRKVRILVIERTGYRLNGDATEPWPWLRGARAAQLSLLRASVHRQGGRTPAPLALAPLADPDMIAVAKSWRDVRDLPPLTADQAEKLVATLRGASQDPSPRLRAWRPLLAMALGERIDAPAPADGERPQPASEIGRILLDAFDAERETRSPRSQRPPAASREATERAANIACLATMLGGIDGARLHRRLAANDDDRARLAAFYGDLGGACGEEARLLLGYPATAREADGGPSFPPRKPDLFGEVMVLQCLGGDLADEARRAQAERRIALLVHDAARLDADALTGFLIRMRQDFGDDPVTQALAAAPWPDGLQLGCDTTLPATFGLSGLLAAMMRGGAPAGFTLDNGAFPLLLAAGQGHVACVRLLLEAGADPGQVNPVSGSFPLLLAAEAGSSDTVAALLRAGAAVDAIRAGAGTFPLLLAAANGAADCVRLLLDAGADANRLDPLYGMSPLLAAAQNGHAACVAVLLAAGADADPPGPPGRGSALAAATRNGFPECARLLGGADPARAEPEPVAPAVAPPRATAEPGGVNRSLNEAARLGDATQLRLLLAAGTDPNQVDAETGDFPLLLAANSGHADCVRLLLAAGADPNQVDAETGDFPLLLAANSGHADCVRLLLEAGADPNQVDTETGGFPLLLAAGWGHDACVRLLLQASAHPDQVDTLAGSFPLPLAAFSGHADCIRLLLEAGADPNQVDTVAESFPLQLAARLGHAECTRLLLKGGADPGKACPLIGEFPLLIAASHGRAEFVRLFLEAGADPNQVSRFDGDFPLLIAANSGHADCVRLLLEAGADPNQVNQFNGRFPLLLAANSSHADCVRLLLAAGADPNQVNQLNGEFPLLLAAADRETAVVDLLLAGGARHDRAGGRDRLTPVQRAAQHGRAGVLTALVKAGADPDAPCPHSGDTPLLTAIAYNQLAAAQVLIALGADPNRPNPRTGVFPLLKAAAVNPICVAVLLAGGAIREEVNLRDGSTPLGVAIAADQGLTVSLLLTERIDLERPVDASGLLPLQIAARDGRTGIVDTLLQAYADPDGIHGAGPAPLLLAAQNGHRAVFDLLLKAEAKPLPFLVLASEAAPAPLASADFGADWPLPPILGAPAPWQDLAPVDLAEAGLLAAWASRNGLDGAVLVAARACAAPFLVEGRVLECLIAPTPGAPLRQAVFLSTPAALVHLKGEAAGLHAFGKLFPDSLSLRSREHAAAYARLFCATVAGPDGSTLRIVETAGDLAFRRAEDADAVADRLNALAIPLTRIKRTPSGDRRFTATILREGGRLARAGLVVDAEGGVRIDLGDPLVGPLPVSCDGFAGLFRRRWWSER